MTQEDKKLLMKDLSARVSYGVKYMKYSWGYGLDQEIPEVEVLECVDKNGYISHIKVYKIDDIKPYLFPLSSMTNELKEEFDQLLELELKAINDEIDHIQATEFEVDFYNKHHLDWRGLIPLGLALDATDKNIY